MANEKYLDKNGLIYFWSKLKVLFNNKVDKVEGKGLSTNDYTTVEKTKLAGIEEHANNYSLPISSASTLGGIKVGNNLTIDPDTGVLSAVQGTYVLPKATTTTLGGIIVGDNLSIDSTGKLSATDTTYTAGANVQINNGVISATDTTYGVATTSTNGLMSSGDKTKLNGIAEGAEVNQNAFSNIAVGDVTIEADSETDTVTIVAGNNVTITPDAANDKITIEATDTVYVHPSYTPVTGKPTDDQTPTFGGSFVVSQIASDSTGHVTSATDRTITIPSSLASSSAAGLMSSADKTKLDSINVSEIYKYKGSVPTVEDLPTSGVSVGDVYNVESDGMNYAWNGTEWDALGGSFSIDAITNAEIDDIMAA